MPKEERRKNRNKHEYTYKIHEPSHFFKKIEEDLSFKTKYTQPNEILRARKKRTLAESNIKINNTP